MRYLLFALLLTVVSCADTGRRIVAGAAVPSEVTLIAKVDSSRSVDLFLTNNSSYPIGYNLCSSALERRNGQESVPVPLDIVCTTELRNLPPGEQDVFRHSIPADLPAGYYRMTTRVESPIGSSAVPVASSTFELR